MMQVFLSDVKFKQTDNVIAYNRPKIQSTVYPDQRLSFNDWAKYIHQQILNLKKQRS